MATREHAGVEVIVVRIRDVAQYAGVSTATVSRVLNGKTVNSAMAAAVRDAVEALGYTPDRTARSLRTRSSRIVALVVPDVENPTFTAVARGVEDVARSEGYSVVLCNTDEDPTKEAHYLGVIADENMAGVIIAPATDAPELSPLRRRQRSVVVLDRWVRDPVDQVAFDNVALGRLATQELIQRGHERIACITGPRRTPTAVDRALGWRQALSEAGLSVQHDLLIYANFRVDGGYDAIHKLLERPDPPDAVIATNNLVGVGVLRALAEHGGGPAATAEIAAAGGPWLGVGIVGELPLAISPLPEVGFIPMHPRQMGVSAAEMLIARIHGDDGPPRTLVQPF